MLCARAASSGILAISLTATAVSASPQQRSLAVYGRVMTSDGGPVRRDVTVLATPVDGGDSFQQPIEAGGTFRLEDLTPGRYVISTRPAFDPARENVDDGEGGRTMVTVATQDVGPVVLRTGPMHSMQGRVRFDSDAPDAVRPLWLSLHASSVVRGGAAEVHESTARVQSDATFTLHNLLGPTIVRFGMELQPGHLWYPGPVLLDGKDITNVPIDFAEHQGGNLEVVFTRQPSGLFGRARDASGLPVAGAYVIAMSQDPSLQEAWSSTTMAVQADDEGRYWLIVPPGRYLVAAVDSSTFSSWDHARLNFAAIEAVAGPADVQESVAAYRDVTLVKPTAPIKPLPQTRSIMRAFVRAEEVK